MGRRLVEIINSDLQVGTVEVSGVRGPGPGARGPVSLALVWDEIAAGDLVLVHVGFAPARIDEVEAERTQAWLDGIVSELMLSASATRFPVQEKCAYCQERSSDPGEMPREIRGGTAGSGFLA